MTGGLFIQDLAEFSYLRLALAASVLASVACGVTGGYVVARRRSYLVGAMSHALIGGVGLARYLQVVHGVDWFTPMVGALVAAVLAATLVSLMTLDGRMREDTILSAVWTLGVAAGVSFMAATPGYAEDLNSYLFGNILLVSVSDLWMMAVLDGVILAVAWLLHGRFVALCFHEEGLQLRGINVAWVSWILHVLIGMTVVLLTQVVGVVLVLALLVLPSASGALFARRLPGVMLIGVGLSLVFCVGGLAVSYGPGWPVGATIVELAVGGYVFLYGVHAVVGRLRRGRGGTDGYPS
ncbi:MAG: metal ABC transporter permease [Lentisphaeria bacterium]|nr:metal ABC transporter permease [Lentisphaeria bacterium]